MKTRALTVEGQDLSVKNVYLNRGRLQGRSRLCIAAICLLPFTFSLIGCRNKTSAAEPAPVAVKIKTVEMNTVNNDRGSQLNRKQYQLGEGVNEDE